VPSIRVQQAAGLRLDDIYRYTRDRWGRQQADRYIKGLFQAAQGLALHTTFSHPIPAEFGIVDGYFFRYQHHFVYWRTLSNDDIGIVTVLHEKMHQIARFREDFALTSEGSDR
jgi:plasmid stabilization system protein ParE